MISGILNELFFSKNSRILEIYPVNDGCWAAQENDGFPLESRHLKFHRENIKNLVKSNNISRKLFEKPFPERIFSHIFFSIFFVFFQGTRQKFINHGDIINIA